MALIGRSVNSAKKPQHAAALSSLLTWFTTSPRAKAAAADPEELARTPSSHAQLPSSSSASLHRVFCRFDEDGDGRISPAELRSCMRAMGEELSPEDAAAVVESADSDGDGLLGLDDFASLVDREGEQEKERESNFREAFRAYEEGGGRITPRSLRSALGKLGERRSVEECAAMISQFDIDGDGFISFDEFSIMMRE